MSAPRYGIAEIFGQDLTLLAAERISELAGAKSGSLPCPFAADGRACRKRGGVCSLRLFEEGQDGTAVPADAPVACVCPRRFEQGNEVTRWVGETMLNSAEVVPLPELPFLKSSTGSSRSVGKIDLVLVLPDSVPLAWCALETQAVYFSGKAMASELRLLQAWRGPGLPFPTDVRRPDFRSSGPKRLMPQLQIKVPTLSRWGKKTAVVVDLAFWESMGEMGEVRDISNCDIAWFVVDWKPGPRGLQATRHALHLTTLDRAVEGLTGGYPSSLAEFELELRNKLSRRSSDPANSDRAR